MSEDLRIRPVSEMDHHPVADRLAQILCTKTQNTNPLFFRVLVAYYFSVVSTMMRCQVQTHDGNRKIPVNCYAINLATSGAGKGKSTSIMEGQVINQFRERFTEETLPILAERNLPNLAMRRAARNQTDPDEELEKATNEFHAIGPLYFSFDKGSPEAIKAMRHKLLMANAGSMNLQIDEIGYNLTGSMEALITYLELYDIGHINPKLTKNTKDNPLREQLKGLTPANAMLFGTPSKLLDGSKVEEEFYDLLDSGYARRCLFGYVKGHDRNKDLSVDDLYDLLTDADTNDFLDQISDHLGNLADIINANKTIVMSKRVAKLFLKYKLQCEAGADELPEHDEMKKAELSHRYFKAMKLAGAYAFVDDSAEITEAHFEHAVKLVEESG